MSDNSKGEFWAFVAGVLAGGIFAILYAPAKGEETREKIRETAGELRVKGEDILEEGRKKLDEYTEKGKETYTHLKDESEKLVKTGHEKLDEYTEKGKEAVEFAKGKIDEVKDKVKAKGKEPETAE